MTEKELDEMIAEANCDKDGHIDYDGMYFLQDVDCRKTRAKSLAYIMSLIF